MTPDPKITDDQLRASLRDVPQPAGLERHLLEIANREPRPDRSPPAKWTELGRWHSRRRPAFRGGRRTWQVVGALAVVAGMAVAAWSWWGGGVRSSTVAPQVVEKARPYFDRERPMESTGRVESTGRALPERTKRGEGTVDQQLGPIHDSQELPTEDWEALLAAQQTRLAEIEGLLAQWQAERRQQAAEAKRLDRWLAAPAAEWTTRETWAMALAVSSETVAAGQASPTIVRAQLAEVVRAFPETAGAGLARRLLDSPGP